MIAAVPFWLAIGRNEPRSVIELKARPKPCFEGMARGSLASDGLGSGKKCGIRLT